MNIDPNTGIWLDEDRHRIYDTTLAEKIVEFCRERKFKTVVDLGCGAGFYVKHLKQGGISCVGYDGNPHTPEITANECGVLDLSQPIRIGKYSCVMSLEVGEHIPATFQEIYITNLLNSASDYLVMSWALPGQGGAGHFNERPTNEIINRIEQDGRWKLDPVATFLLRRSSSLPWFQNTILCFECTGTPQSEPVFVDEYYDFDRIVGRRIPVPAKA